MKRNSQTVVFRQKRQARAFALLFDLIVFFLLVSSVKGGWLWDGKIRLGHAPDLYRVIFSLFLFVYFFAHPIRDFSYFCRGVRKGISDLHDSSRRWLVLSGITLFACIKGVFQALAFHFPIFDVGIFHQVIWSISQGEGFLSTVSGAGNFLLDHLSVSLVFLAPFFLITSGSPVLLPVLHALLIFGGVAAWLYLAERFPRTSFSKRQVLAGAVVVFAICFDSLWANLKWGFHANAIYFCSISWALVLIFAEERSESIKKWKAPIVLALLLVAAGAKEILLVNVALFLSVWTFWLFLKRKKTLVSSTWFFVLPLCAVVLLIGFLVFESMPHPEGKNYFIRYYSYLGSSPKEFFSAVFLNPLALFRKVLDSVGGKELLTYIISVFGPWLFLPLLGVFFKGQRWWPMLWLLPI